MIYDSYDSSFREPLFETLNKVLDTALVPGGGFRFKKKLEEMASTMEIYKKLEGVSTMEIDKQEPWIGKVRKYSYLMACSIELMKIAGYAYVSYSLHQSHTKL